MESTAMFHAQLDRNHTSHIHVFFCMGNGAQSDATMLSLNRSSNFMCKNTHEMQTAMELFRQPDRTNTRQAGVPGRVWLGRNRHFRKTALPEQGAFSKLCKGGAVPAGTLQCKKPPPPSSVSMKRPPRGPCNVNQDFFPKSGFRVPGRFRPFNY